MSELWNLVATHWMTLPIVVPLLGGFATATLRSEQLALQRWAAATVLVATAAASVATVEIAAGGRIFVYELSNWSAPFGIVLMVDRMSAILVAATSLLGIGAWLYAIVETDTLSDHFHPLFLIQIAGINGAFLTGDVFNLFVFFEVLLIASYSLLIYGGGEDRTGAALQYVVLNLVGSALFLMGVGLVYGVTGTLNMADLAVAFDDLPSQHAVIAQAGALLMMVVFGLKAAVLPLYFWLPRAYSAATAPVAALFAVMTKVGVYAILRTSTLAFSSGPVSDITSPWLVPIAVATIAVGALGVAAARRLRILIAYLVLVSVGTLLLPVAVGTADSIAAALYYLVHSTFVTGALFLIADVVADQRGEAGDSLDEGPAIVPGGWLAVLFFAAGIVIVGLPPTSGFLGKAFILESALASEWTVWIWAAILASSLLAIVALARAGSRLFWESDHGAVPLQLERPARAAGPLVMAGFVVAWTWLAGPAYSYLSAAADQMLAPDNYVEAVDPQDFDPSEVGKKGSKSGSKEGHH